MTHYTLFELCPTITDGCARINEHDENILKTTEAMISFVAVQMCVHEKQENSKENEYTQTVLCRGKCKCVANEPVENVCIVVPCYAHTIHIHTHMHICIYIRSYRFEFYDHLFYWYWMWNTCDDKYDTNYMLHSKN